MKILLRIIITLCLVLLVWFSFFKKYDHRISFEVNISPLAFHNMLLDSTKWSSISQNQPKIIDVNNARSINHKLKINQIPFELYWEITNKNDTNSEVKLYYKNLENSIKERVLSLIRRSDNQKVLKEIAIGFKQSAKQFSENFKINIEGIDTIPSLTYLYIDLKGKRDDKALNMIKANALLFVKNNDSLVKKNGNVFVKIQSWNTTTDSIAFRYAFPIQPQKQYPTDTTVKADSLLAVPALKATYYGNYRNSDQAWLALITYAESHHIELDMQPLEIFYNNPISGGDDRKWKAEIYIPIKTH